MGALAMCLVRWSSTRRRPCKSTLCRSSDYLANLLSGRSESQKRLDEQTDGDGSVRRLHLGESRLARPEALRRLPLCPSCRTRTSRRKWARASLSSTKAASSGVSSRKSSAVPTRHPAPSERNRLRCPGQGRRVDWRAGYGRRPSPGHNLGLRQHGPPDRDVTRLHGHLLSSLRAATAW
jgi:hypothetical protein